MAEPTTTTAAAAVTAVGPLAVGALSVWRLAHLITSEDGPFDVIVRARRRVGHGAVGQLVDCFACTSVWVAVPVALLLGARRGRELALVALALSGAACLAERLPDGGEPPLQIINENQTLEVQQ